MQSGFERVCIVQAQEEMKLLILFIKRLLGMSRSAPLKKGKRHRDTVDGQFTTAAKAAVNPETTVSETIQTGKHRLIEFQRIGFSTYYFDLGLTEAKRDFAQEFGIAVKDLEEDIKRGSVLVIESEIKHKFTVKNRV